MKRTSQLKCAQTFGAFAAVAALVIGGGALAQDKFPSKQIDVVLHAGAGGGTDITVRTVLPDAEKALGVNMVILNKQGGNGVVAMKYMEQQPGDGYQLMTLTASHLAAIIRGKVDMKLQDISCLVRLTDDPQYIVAKKGRFESTDAMLKYIKSNSVKIGGAQVGGTDHMAVASFARKVEGGLKYDYVPFKGAPEIGAGLIKGDIDIGMGNYSELESMIDANEIETVLVMSPERQDVQPDTPTAKEKGIDASFSSIRAIGTLSKVPADRKKILEDGLVKAMEGETYQKYLSGIGLSPKTTSGAAKCDAQLVQLFDDTAASLKELGFVK